MTVIDCEYESIHLWCPWSSGLLCLGDVFFEQYSGNDSGWCSNICEQCVFRAFWALHVECKVIWWWRAWLLAFSWSTNFICCRLGDRKWIWNVVAYGRFLLDVHDGFSITYLLVFKNNQTFSEAALRFAFFWKLDDVLTEYEMIWKFLRRVWEFLWWWIQLWIHQLEMVNNSWWCEWTEFVFVPLPPFRRNSQKKTDIRHCMCMPDSSW